METMTNTAEILLDYLKKINKSFPGLFQDLDGYRKQHESSWPEYCYIPRFDIALFLKKNWKNKYENPKITVHDNNGAPIECTYRAITALYNWRSHKKIYRFDPDLAKMLCDQADNSDPYKIILPIEILRNLPFNGMYIDADIGYAPCGEKYHGAFIYIDYMQGTPVFVITKTPRFVTGKHAVLSPFHDDLELYEGKSVGECIDITESNIAESIEQDTFRQISWFDTNKKEQLYHDRKIQWRVINLFMYILAANADIESSPETRDTYRPRTDPDKPFKDAYREIEQLNVGYRIGNTIRSSRGHNNTRATEEFKRIPHVRSGHWHRYWTGPRSSDSRTQIIKWIPPIFVNGYNENFNVVSISPVE